VWALGGSRNCESASWGPGGQPEGIRACRLNCAGTSSSRDRWVNLRIGRRPWRADRSADAGEGSRMASGGALTELRGSRVPPGSTNEAPDHFEKCDIAQEFPHELSRRLNCNLKREGRALFRGRLWAFALSASKGFDDIVGRARFSAELSCCRLPGASRRVWSFFCRRYIAPQLPDSRSVCESRHSRIFLPWNKLGGFGRLRPVARPRS
jgi:hypothetical protein